MSLKWSKCHQDMANFVKKNNKIIIIVDTIVKDGDLADGDQISGFAVAVFLWKTPTKFKHPLDYFYAVCSEHQINCFQPGDPLGGLKMA